MNFYCQLSSIFSNSNFLLTFVELFIFVGVVILFWKGIKTIFHIKKEWFMRLLMIIPWTIISLFIFVFISIAVTIILFLTGVYVGDHPPSSYGNELNAAIKNTCFLDPQKTHCPKTVEDIIKIDPEKFTKIALENKITYEYYPETNQYTLIIHKNNIKENDYRVAIFDPRLVNAKNYGRGVDLYDTYVYKCHGKYVLKKAPPFPGPWDKIN